MDVASLLGNTALLGFIKDQKIREIISKREFRLSEEYLHRELVNRATHEKVSDLALAIYDGYARITGKVKQWPVTVPVPFMVRFAVHGVHFSPDSKNVFLRVEEVRPHGGDLLLGKLSGRIPFITYEKGIVACDLTQVPQLGELFGYRVKGVKVMDYVTVREIELNEGELVARLGVSL